MTPERVQDASRLLCDAWTSGEVIDALPDPVRPGSREEGYAIQALLESRSAQPLYGWKIAATGKEGQKHINVDGPLAGRLLAERVVANGGSVPSSPNRMRVAEVEFAFRMGRGLAPRDAPYTADEVLDAVATVHAAIEIPDSRYEDFTAVGAAQLIADDACAHYFVCAESTGADWRSLDLVAHRALGRVGGRYEREGSGAAVLGDPRVALTWLANELRALGIPLRSGQTVTTGTCFKPLELEPGDVVTADLGVLGRATVRFD
ncbi:MAG: 2-keto-4-pentenoate hydratase [Vicinamibacteria bacterium]